MRHFGRRILLFFWLQTSTGKNLPLSSSSRACNLSLVDHFPTPEKCKFLTAAIGLLLLWNSLRTYFTLWDSMSCFLIMCTLHVMFLNYVYFGLGVRVFANGPGDLGSIPGRVIPKTQKMVLDASLLNTQHYKVRIKGKVEQSREGVAPPLHLGVVAIEKGAFGLPSTMVANFTYIWI